MIAHGDGSGRRPGTHGCRALPRASAPIAAHDHAKALRPSARRASALQGSPDAHLVVASPSETHRRWRCRCAPARTTQPRRSRRIASAWSCRVAGAAHVDRAQQRDEHGHLEAAAALHRHPRRRVGDLVVRLDHRVPAAVAPPAHLYEDAGRSPPLSSRRRGRATLRACRAAMNCVHSWPSAACGPMRACHARASSSSRSTCSRTGGRGRACARRCAYTCR